ncbi:hypothetical protein EAH89_25245 [Roseomonas nepalensis]|uniref:Uncharacterized protein n=1 Tax=Muricoccus nepalensis TaxID=1854500 RepID=A0A502F9G3_9PROT|nr:hypothetical protein [Roseomonas nepalensis]TPG46036.1 hypothetical protein EAH89_25245 [Roseomonas nepalensis]
MPTSKSPIAPPLAGDVHPGRRFSLCGEALAPALIAMQAQAVEAGWHPREVAVAVMTWAVTQATAIDGAEAVSEALMLSLDVARLQESKA